MGTHLRAASSRRERLEFLDPFQLTRKTARAVIKSHGDRRIFAFSVADIFIIASYLLGQIRPEIQ